MIDARLSKLMSCAEQLNLPAVLAPVAAIVARERKLSDQLLATRAAADSAFASAVSEMVSSGEISSKTTDKLAFSTMSAPQSSRVLERAVEHARAVFGRDAMVAGKKSGPAVLVALKAAADAAVVRVAALAIPTSVVDEQTAFATRVSQDGWLELHAAFECWSQAHEAYKALREMGWVPVPAPGGVGERWLRYANPIRCPQGQAFLGAKKLSPALNLAHCVAAGARPGMLTLAEAEAAFSRWREAAKAAERAGTPRGPREEAAQHEQICRAVDGSAAGRIRPLKAEVFS